MSLEGSQRARLVTGAILGLVLAAGFLLGMAWDRRLATSPAVEAATDPAQAGTEDRRRRRRGLFHRVEPALDADQLAEAEAITALRREAARSLFSEPLIDSLYNAMKAAEDDFEEMYDPPFRALIDSSRAAIRQLMTPEQATNYDSVLAENDRRRRDGGG